MCEIDLNFHRTVRSVCSSDDVDDCHLFVFVHNQLDRTNKTHTNISNISYGHSHRSSQFDMDSWDIFSSSESSTADWLHHQHSSSDRILHTLVLRAMEPYEQNMFVDDNESR